MARPRKYDDGKILQVAARIFLDHGAAASTALIAREAGVSEGVLFQRFKTKEALFEASLMLDTESNSWRKTLLESAGRGTVRGNLRTAILSLFEKLEKLVPKLMILEGRGHLRTPPKGSKAPPVEDAEAITAYLKKEARLGRWKLDRPELHAHEIIGAVVHCTMLKLRHQKEVCPPKAWADHLVENHVAETRGRKPSTR